MDEDQIASQLKGNTLRVYWLLLKSSKNPVGARDIQRKLRFSSPSLAVCHLDKLVELGLAEKAAGEYRLTRIVDVGVLKQFTRLGGFFILPRHVLYATMWSTLFGFFIFQFRELTFYSLFALVFGILGTVILWFEALKIWRSKPSMFSESLANFWVDLVSSIIGSIFFIGRCVSPFLLQ